MRFPKKISLMLALAVVLSIVCALQLSEVSRRNEKNLEQNYLLISDSVYEAVEHQLGKPIHIALAMANNTFLQDFLSEETALEEADFTAKATDYLSVMKETTGAQTTFLVSEQSRNYYTCTGLNKRVDPENDTHDIWYSVFVNSRKKYDLDIDVDETNENRWTVFVNARINDTDGKYLGTCGIGLSMEDLQETLTQYESKYNVKVNFINSDGVVQVDTDTINIENSYLYDAQYGKEKDGYTYKNKDGKFVVMRFVEDLNWYLVIHGDGNALDARTIFQAVACPLFLLLLALAAIAAEIKKRRGSPRGK